MKKRQKLRSKAEQLRKNNKRKKQSVLKSKEQNNKMVHKQ